MTTLPLPIPAIVRVERLAPGNRVLLRGYYYRVTAIVQDANVIFLDLDGAGRRRFRVGSTLACELRP